MLSENALPEKDNSNRKERKKAFYELDQRGEGRHIFKIFSDALIFF